MFSSEIKSVHFTGIGGTAMASAAAGATRCVLARSDLDRFPYSHLAFINCQMCPQVPPEDWEAKGADSSHLQFAEFHSTDAQGNLVDVSRRLPTSRQLTEAEAAELSDPAKVFARHDNWDPRTTPATVLKSNP
jgi:hypothetical protein